MKDKIEPQHHTGRFRAFGPSTKKEKGKKNSWICVYNTIIEIIISMRDI